MTRIALLMCIMLASCANEYPDQRERSGSGIAPEAPEVGVTDLEGNQVDLHEYVNEGNPAIVNFWAASCAFCKVELPWFQRLHERHDRLRVVGVNMQEPDSLARSYWQKGGYTFPTLLDPKNTLRKRYRVSIQPTTLFIDESGRIVDRKDGPLTESELQSMVEKILKEPIDKKNISNSFSQGSSWNDTDSGKNEQLSESPLNKEIMTSEVPPLLSTWYDGSVRHIIPLDEIFSGGPPKDGIPSIDSPTFTDTADADMWLGASDMGILLTVEGDARFYPYHILNWHEIVNDTVGGKNVFITYCPLCATGVVYESRTMKGVSEFGVSGLLYQSNLLMYDRNTDSLWNQVTGRAVVGPLTGDRLTQLTSHIITYDQAKRTATDVKVLSRDTGYSRNYDIEPYGGYEERRDAMFPTDAWGRANEVHPKTLVYGIVIDGVAKAYRQSVIHELGVLEDDIDGAPVRFTYDDSTGRLLVTERASGQQVPVMPVYWFAWVAQYPDSLLFEG